MGDTGELLNSNTNREIRLGKTALRKDAQRCADRRSICEMHPDEWHGLFAKLALVAAVQSQDGFNRF